MNIHTKHISVACALRLSINHYYSECLAFLYGFHPSRPKASGWPVVTRQPWRALKSMLLKVSGLRDGRKLSGMCWHEQTPTVSESRWQLKETLPSLKLSNSWWTSLGLDLLIVVLTDNAVKSRSFSKSLRLKLESISRCELRCNATPEMRDCSLTGAAGETRCSCCVTG